MHRSLQASYDNPDNYELQQHRQSSVVVEVIFLPSHVHSYESTNMFAM